MNMKQRMVIFFGILLFILSILYPPYLGKQTREFMDSPPKHFTKLLGYHLILIGPPESNYYSNRVIVTLHGKLEWSDDLPYTRKILFPLWLAQLAIIVVLTVVFVKVFRNKPPKNI
jgi:hypothetical protein